MSQTTGSFWLGLLLLVFVFSLLAFLILGKMNVEEFPAALSGILASALAAALGFLQMKRVVRAGNLKFLKTFFAGLFWRFAILALSAAVLQVFSEWSLRVFLFSLALSYPLLLIYETWRVSGLLPTWAETREREDQ